MMRASIGVWTFLCLVAVQACGHGGGAGAPVRAARTAEPTADDPPPPTLAGHMQANFALSLDARDAVVAGDLGAAKSHAQALLESADPTLFPPDWKPWIERMRQHADAVTLAPDLPGAATAVAQLGLACGNCHWRAGKGPALAPVALVGHPEPGAPELPTRMQRHRIAADELWFGLVQPSDALWRQGTVTFTRAEFAAPVEEGAPLPGWMAAEVEALRPLAEQARMAATHEARAGQYGQILARCADCHRQVAR